MFNIYKKEIQWGGRTLSIETGHMSRQALGSVVVTYGETVVHAAVCASKIPPATLDGFFPLTVNYQEKFYAAGSIPGGFFKREGRPSEKEVLTSRLIDRPIRPLFVEGFKNETQVTCTTLVHDKENDPDIVAMIATSAALTLSGLPFLGPIGAARVGYINGEYTLNTEMSKASNSQLDLVVAGTRDGVLMVESEAQELSEEIMLGAVNFGHSQFLPVIDMIIELAEQAAKDPFEVAEAPAELAEVEKILRENIIKDLDTAYKITKKAERQAQVNAVREKAIELIGENEAQQAVFNKVFHDLEAEVVRFAVLDTGIRIDGRDTKTVRPITCEVGVLPRVHGSALFTRGETQALVVTTLGTGEDEQIIDDLAGEYKRRFMLHYNFPSYSVNEVRRQGSPGRREIGHGKLAWRAINPMLPEHEKFPYTIRVVSEIMESNGSSSMATVCGGSLSLMDAGVPTQKPVAGIAMGLIKEGERFTVLTDILGDEDHLGDMDFKVAGTKDGVTALQMDIKITSITMDIMKVALEQAHDGRCHILGKMAEALSETRPSISKYAPKITTISIPKDKIREVIGTGGKVIRDIVEKSGAKIDIDDDGIINIAATNTAESDIALKMIQDIVAEPEIGQIYEGKVVKVMDFGAFVNFLGANDGLVHISELADHRVEKVTDVINEGDIVKVKCLGIDSQGKIKLSIKQVEAE